MSEGISGEYYDAYVYSGNVRLVSASPTLSLLPSELRGAVRELLDEMTEAYQEWMDDLDEDDAPTTGIVVFEVQVDASGKAVSISITGDGISTEVDAECCEILEELAISAPPEGAGTVRIQLEFRLI